MWSEKPIRGNLLPSKTLCLTFDDGPGRGGENEAGPQTLELAQYLSELGVAAIFFVVGKHARENPESIQKISSFGHTVGNHSFSHRSLTGSLMKDRDVVDEILETDRLVRSSTNSPIFFRPPYGAWSPRLSHLLNANLATCLNGAGPIGWDIGGRDYVFWRDGLTPEACAVGYHRIIEKRKRKNGIVLCHDATADDQALSRRNRTFEMTRILVPRLLDLGYRFENLHAIPEIQERARMRMQGALRASNGLYLSLSQGGEDLVTASASGIGDQCRFNVAGMDGGTIRIESGEGRPLWSGLTVIPLEGGSFALRSAAGLYLVWNRKNQAIELGTADLTALGIFRFTLLGHLSDTAFVRPIVPEFRLWQRIRNS